MYNEMKKYFGHSYFEYYGTSPNGGVIFEDLTDGSLHAHYGDYIWLYSY